MRKDVKTSEQARWEAERPRPRTARYVRCPHCRRMFLPGGLVIHLRSKHQ